MKKIFFIFCAITILLPFLTLAADYTPPAQAPASGQTASTPASSTTLPNPLGTTNINDIIKRVIQTFLGILGGIALLMFLWGGAQWLVSRGNPKMVQAGKNTIIWAILGIIVIFSAYILLQFIFTALGAK